MTFTNGLKYLLAASSTCLLATASQAAPAYTHTTLPANAQRASMAVHIWYPRMTGGIQQSIGAGSAFTGTQVVVDAKPQSGAHPVIVMSHGSGGNAVNLGWIAGHLAELGFVVLAPNHPGTTSGDSSAEQTIKLWQRPGDLSAVLDRAQSMLPHGLVIDPQRVGAVGFSLGGYTVLALAGARVNKQAYIDYCENWPDMNDCQWFRAKDVALESIDKTPYEQDNRDPRVRFVIAIDPAAGHAMSQQSLRAIDVPVQLINLGLAGQIPAAIDASVIADQILAAKTHHIAQASHFSFLGLCTDIGEKIMQQVGEEPICSDPGQRSRADIHEELKKVMGAFALQQLSHRQ